jgi:SAM-dependent methyltransferase
MSEPSFRDYRRYVTDERWARQYSDYQKRYVIEPRESDKKSARLVLSALREMRRRKPRILDIGCSTGNFLALLQKLCRDAEMAADLTGGDLMVPAIEECRANPALAGIQFEVMDVFDLPTILPFDVIVANAVTYLFDREQFRRVCASIANALRPGGRYVGYELVFPGDKEERVVEKSNGHPEGLQLMLRSETFVRASLGAVGFEDVEVVRFDIPIDLPKPEPNGTDADLITYTVRDAVTGQRLMYRGALYQPWAHIEVRKAS